jgi:plastocyanin
MLRATAAALVALALLITTGCAASSGSASETASGEPSSTDADALEIVVSVKDKKVAPKTHREKVAKGSQVRLVVTSDVDDEVHVHGYDIEKELSAGQPTTLEFTADQTGLFEVETHESGLQLLQLEVK